MNDSLVKKIQTIAKQFLPSAAELLEIADQFQKEMTKGLAGGGYLKMLRSFLPIPTGQEKGSYITIDFGGTNIRIQVVELLGVGKTRLKKKLLFPLKNPTANYDYTSPTATAEELFDFIAAQIGKLVETNQSYPLGHTFSFPCRQLSVNRANLLSWTKEIKTAGMEGQEITALLEAALQRANLHQVIPVAIINDTTGTLLTASYRNPRATIGSICGTGHNTCYLEPQEPTTDKPMIINMESGNFNKFFLSPYDKLLDQSSEKPGQQALEKAVAGHYLGEIARLLLFDLWQQGLLFANFGKQVFHQPYSLKTRDLASFLEDNTPQLAVIRSWLQKNCCIPEPTLEECSALKTIARLVTTRSARLITATYAGVLQHIDPELSHPHVIAVDGSLFEKMPLYQTTMQQALADIFQEKARHISLVLVKDGSGTGAAIAAAVCQK